jgi:hypothetical protein
MIDELFPFDFHFVAFCGRAMFRIRIQKKKMGSLVNTQKKDLLCDVLGGFQKNLVKTEIGIMNKGLLRRNQLLSGDPRCESKQPKYRQAMILLTKKRIKSHQLLLDFRETKDKKEIFLE